MKLITPFPLSLSIGTDVVHLSRINRLITRPVKNNTDRKQTYLDRFSRRILCAQEQEEFRKRFINSNFYTPNNNNNNNVVGTFRRVDLARWLAGRFAAKEAARKAAPGGASSLSWKDVMVRVEDGGQGKPEIVYLRDGGQRGEAGKLSISHDGDYVVATVLAAAPASASAPVG